MILPEKISLPLRQLRIQANIGMPKTPARKEAETLSQEALALRINILQGQVSRYESVPETIPLDIALRWCEACGFSIDETVRISVLMDQKKIDFETAVKTLRANVSVNETRVEPGEPYAELHSKLDLLRRYVEAAPKIQIEDLPSLPIAMDDIDLKIDLWGRKPNLLIMGRFDSGKTRIANALLGSDNLPSQYTPTTSVVTYIRHLADRPDWQMEDVWMMRAGFDPLDWNKKEECQDFRVRAGGYEALQRFGTKDGEDEDVCAKSALVYMDAPILHACTLIDVPGFQDSEEDSKLATNSAALADVLLYTSPAKGFLDASDFIHLGQLLRMLTPIQSGEKRYANFFLIATHADPSIPKDDLDRILEKGSRRLYRHLGDTLFTNDSHRLSEPELRERMIPFWYETENRRKELLDGVEDALSKTLPAAITKRVDEEVKEVKAKARTILRKAIDSCEFALAEKAAALQNIEALREQAPQQKQKIKEKKVEFKRTINGLRKETKDLIHGEIAERLTPENVKLFIEKRFEKEKDNAKKDGIVKLIEEIQFRFDGFLGDKSVQLKEQIDAFLCENFKDKAEGIHTSDFADFQAIPFDAQGAFAGGLAAAGTLGALTVWASAMGNLGGYILVAKLASVLSVAGLGIGSSALITFVSAIGGPVTLALGLAAAVTIGIWSLFGESWESRLAKKISRTLADNGLLKKIEDRGDAFWDETWTAFESAASHTEAKFDEYLQKNEDLLNADSVTKINKAIASLEDLRIFFGGILWRSPM